MKIKTLVAVAITSLIAGQTYAAMPEGEMLAENTTTNQAIDMAADTSASTTMGEQVNVGGTMPSASTTSDTNTTDTPPDASATTTTTTTSDMSTGASPDTATGDDDY